MSLSSMYETCPDLESREGIVIDYGMVQARVLRSGGANKKYTNAMRKALKPYAKQIQNEVIDLDVANDLAMEVFAQTCVLSWKTKVGDKFVDGIAPSDAGEEGTDLLPVNYQNLVKVFKKLPALWEDISSQAEKFSNFRKMENDEDVGNS